MLAIDTSIVVRYLTNDHPEQSPRARKLIDGKDVFVPVTVILEVEWVLRGAYGYDPGQIVSAIRSFAGLPTVTVDDAAAVAIALDHCESGMDFADALHLGRSAHCQGMASFDRKFVRTATAAGSLNVVEA